MIVLCDSSALVKRYLQEAGTESVLKLIAEAELVVASRITWLEATSAIIRRARGGAVFDADEVLRALDDDFSIVINIIDVTANIVADARKLVRRHGLRTGDAVQLASVGEAMHQYGKPVRFVCSDRRLVATAREEGVDATDPVG